MGLVSGTDPSRTVSLFSRIQRPSRGQESYCAIDSLRPRCDFATGWVAPPFERGLSCSAALGRQLWNALALEAGGGERPEMRQRKRNPRLWHRKELPVRVRASWAQRRSSDAPEKATVGQGQVRRLVSSSNRPVLSQPTAMRPSPCSSCREARCFCVSALPVVPSTRQVVLGWWRQWMPAPSTA